MDGKYVTRQHEAYRMKPYDDATGKELRPGGMLRGNISIGIGHNLSALGLPGDLIEALYARDYATAEDELYANFPWASGLDEVRKAVLIDMSFNLGITKLKAFRNTLAAFQRGDWRAAQKGMLSSLWARQVGTRAQRLAAMTLTGEWPKDLA